MDHVKKYIRRGVYNLAKLVLLLVDFKPIALYLKNVFIFSTPSNNWEMIYMYNELIDNPNPDCGVPGSCETIHMRRSLKFGKKCY